MPAPGQRGGGEQVAVLVDVVTAQPEQHLLQRCRGLPRLGRVGLVDDDREPLPAQPAHLLQDVREGLQGHDQDLRRLAGKRLGDLLGLGAVGVADLLDDARPVLELVDGVLELRVEHGPVGDHHDLVEDRLVRVAVQVGQPVGQPRDGVGLPRSRGVLDEVVVPGAVRRRVLGQGADGVPLVVAAGKIIGLSCTDFRRPSPSASSRRAGTAG